MKYIIPGIAAVVALAAGVLIFFIHQKRAN